MRTLFWTTVSFLEKMVGRLIIWLPIFFVSVLCSIPFFTLLKYVSSNDKLSKDVAEIFFSISFILILILCGYYYLKSGNYRSFNKLSLPLPPPPLSKFDRRRFSSLIRTATKDYEKRHMEDELKEYVSKENSGYWFLEAIAGLGKTSFIAKIPSIFERDVDSVSYFFVFNDSSSNYEEFSKYVIRYLIWHFGIYRVLSEDNNNRHEQINEILYTISQKHLRNTKKKLLIIIDALDEIDSCDEDYKPLLKLPEKLPYGVFVIISKRPDSNERYVCSENSSKFILTADNDCHRRSIILYARKIAEKKINLYRSLEEEQKKEVIDKICEYAKFNFMYVRCIINDEDYWSKNGSIYELIEHLPPSLKEYYEEHYERMAKGENSEARKYAIFCLTLRNKISVRNYANLLGDDFKKVESYLSIWIAQGILTVIEDGSRANSEWISTYHSTYKKFLEERIEKEISITAYDNLSKNLLDHKEIKEVGLSKKDLFFCEKILLLQRTLFNANMLQDLQSLLTYENVWKAVASDEVNLQEFVSFFKIIEQYGSFSEDENTFFEPIANKVKELLEKGTLKSSNGESYNEISFYRFVVQVYVGENKNVFPSILGKYLYKRRNKFYS